MMALHFFDVRDDDRLFPDDEGTRLAGGLSAARIEAFAALTDYARELKPTADRCRFGTKIASRYWRPCWSWKSGYCRVLNLNSGATSSVIAPAGHSAD
jgi:hypothetical protein